MERYRLNLTISRQKSHFLEVIYAVPIVKIAVEADFVLEFAVQRPPGQRYLKENFLFSFRLRQLWSRLVFERMVLKWAIPASLRSIPSRRSGARGIGEIPCDWLDSYRLIIFN